MSISHYLSSGRSRKSASCVRSKSMSWNIPITHILTTKNSANNVHRFLSAGIPQYYTRVIADLQRCKQTKYSSPNITDISKITATTTCDFNHTHSSEQNTYVNCPCLRWPSVPNCSGQSRILRACLPKNARSFGMQKRPEFRTLNRFNVKVRCSSSSQSKGSWSFCRFCLSEMHSGELKMHKIHFRPRLWPGPRWGSLGFSPLPHRPHSRMARR